MDTLLLDVADHIESGGTQFPTPLDVARHVFPATVQTPALELIDQALMAAFDGTGPRRMVISMPPQEGKSERCSRYFPIWALRQNPDLRVAIVSYSDDLARRWGRQVRNDLRDHPDIGLRVRGDTSAANEWKLAHYNGSMITAGIESGLTGRPVDLLIIDDPLKGRKEADSPVYRKMCIDWWHSVASTRLPASSTAVVILVMTRWHEEDLAGFVLGPDNENREQWGYLNIPAQAVHDDARGVDCKCGGGDRPCAGRDPLDRAPGEYMLSARGRTRDDWEARRKDAGPYDFEALYQGNPTPLEGGVFKRKWWRSYTTPRAMKRADGSWHAIGADQVIQSWDMNFKDTDGSDYVVGQVWARRGPRAWLLAEYRDRVDFPGACAMVRQASAEWPETLFKLVEDKANGPAVISTLRNELGGFLPYSPLDSKLARAYSVSGFVEAGDIEIPAPAVAPWIGAWLKEISSFPNATHDDRVDAMTQALIRLLIIGSDAWSYMSALQAEQQRAGADHPAAVRALPWSTPDDADGRPALAAVPLEEGEAVRPPWLQL